MYVTNASGTLAESTCVHCYRQVFQLPHGPWVDGLHVALCVGGVHAPGGALPAGVSRDLAEHGQPG